MIGKPQVCDGVPVGAPYDERHDADLDAPDRLCGSCRTAYQAVEAAVPDRDRRWQLFAGRHGDAFHHFYPSTTAVQMCGDDDIVLVELALDEAGPYWAWYHSHHPGNTNYRGAISLVYGNPISVEICFPYGTDAEVRRGRGRMVRVNVKALRAAHHPEGIPC